MLLPSPPWWTRPGPWWSLTLVVVPAAWAAGRLAEQADEHLAGCPPPLSVYPQAVPCAMTSAAMDGAGQLLLAFGLAALTAGLLGGLGFWNLEKRMEGRRRHLEDRLDRWITWVADGRMEAGTYRELRDELDRLKALGALWQRRRRTQALATGALALAAAATGLGLRAAILHQEWSALYWPRVIPLGTFAVAALLSSAGLLRHLHRTGAGLRQQTEHAMARLRGLEEQEFGLGAAPGAFLPPGVDHAA